MNWHNTVIIELFICFTHNLLYYKLICIVVEKCNHPINVSDTIIILLAHQMVLCFIYYFKYHQLKNSCSKTYFCFYCFHIISLPLHGLINKFLDYPTKLQFTSWYRSSPNFNLILMAIENKNWWRAKRLIDKRRSFTYLTFYF